jgi:hypothetical protein
LPELPRADNKLDGYALVMMHDALGVWVAFFSPGHFNYRRENGLVCLQCLPALHSPGFDLPRLGVPACPSGFGFLDACPQYRGEKMRSALLLVLMINKRFFKNSIKSQSENLRIEMPLFFLWRLQQHHRDRELNTGEKKSAALAGVAS